MSDAPQHLSTSELEQRFRSATSSDAAARIAAELERRTRHLHAAEQLGRGYDPAAGSAELAARYCRSPLSLAPPAVRATYGPAERLEIANYCGPDDARTVPMDTGKDHAPAGNVHRVHRFAGTIARRGWLVASSDDGRRALMLQRGTGAAIEYPSHELRLGWSA